MAEKPTYEELSQRIQKLEQAESARKRTEKELLESEERFRLAFQTSPDAININRQEDGTYIDINEGFTAATGYTREDIFERPSLSLEVWENPEDRQRMIDSLTKTGYVENLEAGFVGKDGKIKYGLLSARAARIGGENVIISITRDITERKQTEALLLQERELYLDLVNTQPAGIYRLRVRSGAALSKEEWNRSEDPPYVVELVSDRFCEMLKLDKRVFEKDPGILTSLIHEADRAEFVRNYVEANVKQIPFLWEGRLRIGGEICWVYFESRPRPLENGDIVWTGIIYDINERKRTEEALRESEEKYRNILENIEDGYYEVDIAGNYTFFNKSMCRILGYSADELIGKNNREYMDEENAKKIFQAFHGVYQTGISTKALDWKLIRKDGSERFVETIVSLVTDSNNNKVGFRGIARDVSGRKLIEAQLRQARKMESIGTLTGGIAHDFNNIMGIILGNTELALDDVPEGNPARSNLEEIKTASLRATNIVRQLLSFSRKTEQKLHPIEIASVIKEALLFLRSTIPTSIEIQQNIQARGLTVLADPTQINQIMMHLCINASHAMEQTGGNLAVHVEKVILDDHSAKDDPDLRSGAYVQVTVSDTGPGIDPEIANRIFDPYFTTKEVGKGSGMGLAVVHGIVKNHRGVISVDSRPGSGTTFRILIPVVSEKPGAEAETTDELLQGNERILFVDDEASIAKMTSQVLRRLGYRVETRINPLAALELFQSKPDQFDLVMTDMTMPKMTGVTLAEKLMQIRSDIPVIICTGHSSLINENKAKGQKIAAYMMKPIMKQEMAKTLRKVLDRPQVSGIG